MKYSLIVPFFLQGLVILFDEFYFHHQRGLGKWERLGHPLDTLALLLCFIFVTCIPFSSQSGFGYVFLAISSSLLITKDEWIHAQECKPNEIWLHSILFILHPIVLMTLGWFYFSGGITEELQSILKFQIFLLCAFMMYQIVYWSWFWKGKNAGN